MTRYFKLQQPGDTWHYFKILDDCLPAVVETLNFLQDVPHIYLKEYNLFDPSDITDYKVLVAITTPIHRIEYEDAYEQAVRGHLSFISTAKSSLLTEPILGKSH